MRRSDTHTTELIMAHPRRRHVRPEHEAIRPVKTQIERDGPRDGRHRHLAARHDVRVATDEGVLRRRPRVVHIKTQPPVLVDAPRRNNTILVVDLDAPFGNLRAAALAGRGTVLR